MTESIGTTKNVGDKLFDKQTGIVAAIGLRVRQGPSSQLTSKAKRFKKLTIDLGNSPKRIVVLVGPNGCGKSSVFDAFLAFANVYELFGGKNYRYHSLLTLRL